VTLEEAREAAIRLLREDYPLAKKAIIELEVFTNSRSKKAVYEIRDFTDHVSEVFADNQSADEAKKHLDEAKTHLRRCIVEPMEYQAERQWLKVHRYYRFALFQIPVLGVTNAHTRLMQAKLKIIEGRQQKTHRDAYETFKESFQITCELADAVHPVRVFLGVLVTIGTPVAAAVALTKLLWP
jgi:hypothetical protein